MNRSILVAVFTAAFAVPSALAQNTSLISISSAGVQGNNTSSNPALSADGRYVVFLSVANTLVPNDTNPVGNDVFVRDRQTGTTTLASVSSSGVQSNGQCSDPTISGDGRFIVFRSLADNLVPNDTNHFADVFVHDMLTGATTRVSVDSAGNEGNGTSTNRSSISSDGRFVAFENSSSNLVPGLPHGGIFVHDRQTGVTTCASVDSSGVTIGGGANPSISADGRFVAFDSGAGNLVPNDLNQASDVFVHDMLTGSTERVSVTSAGNQGRGNSLNAAISADGRFVAFHSLCAALVPGGTPRLLGVFVHDRQTGITSRASVSSTGVPADNFAQMEYGTAYSVSISGDGRFVCFSSSATNLVPGDTNHARDVFVHDNQSGSTVRVDVSNAGEPAPSGAGQGTISADGRTIAFATASYLVPNDFNVENDVYVSENPLLDVGQSLCSGDGSGSECPCGGDGAAGHGCANSIDGHGARLTGNGIAAISNDSLGLTGAGLPESSGLYLQGTTQLGGGVVFGDGLRCVGGTVLRLGVIEAVQHASQFPPSGLSISAVGNVLPGDVRYYQLWYRDPNASLCTSSHFNLTNALQIQWGP